MPEIIRTPSSIFHVRFSPQVPLVGTGGSAGVAVGPGKGVAIGVGIGVWVGAAVGSVFA